MKLQAMYSVQELIDATGADVKYDTMRRWLDKSGISYTLLGGKRYVPLTEIRDKMPKVWDSLLLMFQMTR